MEPAASGWVGPLGYGTLPLLSSIAADVKDPIPTTAVTLSEAGAFKAVNSNRKMHSKELEEEFKAGPWNPAQEGTPQHEQHALIFLKFNAADGKALLLKMTDVATLQKQDKFKTLESAAQEELAASLASVDKESTAALFGVFRRTWDRFEVKLQKPNWIFGARSEDDVFFAWNLMKEAQGMRRPYMFRDLPTTRLLAILLARSQNDVEKESTRLERDVALDRKYESATLLKDMRANEVLAVAQVRKLCAPDENATLKV